MTDLNTGIRRDIREVTAYIAKNANYLTSEAAKGLKHKIVSHLERLFYTTKRVYSLSPEAIAYSRKETPFREEDVLIDDGGFARMNLNVLSITLRNQEKNPELFRDIGVILESYFGENLYLSKTESGGFLYRVIRNEDYDSIFPKEIPQGAIIEIEEDEP